MNLALTGRGPRLTATATRVAQQLGHAGHTGYLTHVEGIGTVGFDDLGIRQYLSFDLLDAEKEARYFARQHGHDEFDLRLVPDLYRPVVTNPFVRLKIKPEQLLPLDFGGWETIDEIDGTLEPWGTDTTMVFTTRTHEGGTYRFVRESWHGRKTEALVAVHQGLPAPEALISDGSTPYPCATGTPGSFADLLHPWAPRPEPQQAQILQLHPNE